MNTKLFVGNLSYNTTENEIQDMFAAFGPVTEVNLITDRMSGRSKGFAFVTMATPEGFQAAIDGLNGKDVDGRAKWRSRWVHWGSRARFGAPHQVDVRGAELSGCAPNAGQTPSLQLETSEDVPRPDLGS